MGERVEEILNYLDVTAEIHTGGQPTPGQIAALGEAGFQVVINLATATSPDALPDEEQLVREAGMGYVWIPVQWEAPQVADFRKFMALFEPHRGFKTFVHCALNMRVSVFIFLYRVIVQHEDPQACAQAVQRIWQPDPTWTAFIQRVLAECRPPDFDSSWSWSWQAPGSG